MDWDVQKVHPACDRCAGPFLDNQAYHCLLRLDKEAPERKDYCQKCWSGDIASNFQTMQPYAAWSGRYRVIVPPPKEEVVRRDHAETLLRQLIARKDPSQKNILFVLAIMLERKKILKPQRCVGRQEAETRKVLVYVHAQTAETILIEDPQIRLTDWNHIQNQVTELLVSDQSESLSGPGSVEGMRGISL